MRTARRLSTTAALAVTSAVLLAAPASAAPAGGLDVTPSPVTPGTTVTVRTAACGTDGTAAGDASAVGAGTFALTSAAGAREAAGRFQVPPSAQPGTYEIVARCASSGGRQVAGDLTVTLTSTAAARERDPVHPRGHVKTGVGGALGPDPVQTAAGVAALAVAAAGGTWLLHRRARGDRF
ncbi:hypothetical protein GCM10018785_60040 [Streptomyces longispororuber]|uniref:Integral membrane protein n=1 Tax=Streptomyces longispororuber TaxID=68230 RepID=A0A919A258_9ACTN|nr:hypothetical protein [Streptomyces longispororuber]GHE84123.1 hypothetical protein GCM10018785_60040 [Streptomyces longispororuber]